MTKDKIIVQSLDEIMGDRFGKYSKYIIQDRALPDVRDGLKPVQRRILYAMYKEGNLHNKAYRKSAKTVGNVIGNYHPHGDSSVYEAMVRMSQDWKMRIPLVDMQGNNGSIDNDPAAAMRYTEARLSPIASELIKDLDKETCLMALNFDDTEYEPTVVPAQFPNLLVNGATGISAGYATDIPPHNLEEVIDATIHRIKYPHCTLDKIMEFVKGPDFPTGAIVEGKDGIRNALKSGRGKVVVRSLTEIVEEKNMNKIVVHEIPYEVNKAELVRKIDEIRFNKSIDGIIEVRDESDRTGLRIVIDLKKDVDVQNTLNYFYKNTDLQKNYNYNMVAIKDKHPVLMGIEGILDGYINHRKEVVTKRSTYELNNALKRKHIIEGLIKTLSILDAVVETIRASKDKSDAKKNIQEKFGFTEVQSEAIVTLQLYRLTNTDILALEKENGELEQYISTLNDILNNEQVLRKVIIDELKEIKKKYPTLRLSQIKDEVQEISIDEQAMILPEDIYVTVTQDGYIKRISQRSYKASEPKTFGKKDNDYLVDLHFASTLDTLLVFTNLGNYLYIPLFRLEEFKWKELGKHISYLVKVAPTEKIIGSVLVKSFDNPSYIALATKQGQVKRVLVKDFEVSRYSRALKCMNLKGNDELVGVSLTHGQDAITLTTKNAFVTVYSENEVSVLGVKAGGVKGIKLVDDEVISLDTFNPLKDSSFMLVSDQVGIKRIHISDVPPCNRATKGTQIFKSPKSNFISILYSYILDTQDTLTLESVDESLDITVKDFTFTSLGSKPSVVAALKGKQLLYCYNPLNLIVDKSVIEPKKTVIENEVLTKEVSEKKHTQNEEVVSEVKIETQPIIKEKQEDEKHFEPISFDDLFGDEF